MVKNAVKIEDVISGVLNTTETSVEKLVNLNNNTYLNSYLINKDYKTISSIVIKRIEEEVESEANLNVLKFYLHELGLIFNLNYNRDLIKGVAING